jgi:formylglycine-generating enzyme required for sulfatase activity
MARRKIVRPSFFYPNNLQNYLTDVGAYTSSASPYGTFDQGGNAWEWNETLIGASRGRRGGSWGLDFGNLHASGRVDFDPTFQFASLGFRVASIPEPGSLTLCIGVLMMLMPRRRP